MTRGRGGGGFFLGVPSFLKMGTNYIFIFDMVVNALVTQPLSYVAEVYDKSR